MKIIIQIIIIIMKQEAAQVVPISLREDRGSPKREIIRVSVSLKRLLWESAVACASVFLQAWDFRRSIQQVSC